MAIEANLRMHQRTEAALLDAPFAHAADIYRELGWTSPIPLGGPGERAKKSPPPKSVTGHDARVPTEKVIATWSRTHGINNIGLHFADDLGVIGIDVDAYLKKGKLKRGAKTLEDLEVELDCKLPQTWMSGARGPGPSGIHCFRVPPGLEFASKYPDVEIIQSKHRYAVCWPSVHPDTGEVYYWYAPGTDVPAKLPPMVDELTELPKAWLAKLLEDARRGVGLDKSQDVSLTEAYEWLDDSPKHMCRAMRNVCLGECTRFEESDSGARYDTMVEGVMALVRLSAEGHHGGVPALDKLEAAYGSAVAGELDRDVDGEWTRALVGAVAAVQGTETETHGAKCPDRVLPVPVDESLWPSPREPFDVAERFIAERYTWSGAPPRPTLAYWRGEFYAWTGPLWEKRSQDALESELWNLLAAVGYLSAAAQPVELRWSPNPAKIAAVVAALRAVCLREDDDGAPGIISTTSCALDVTAGKREVLPHTPWRFNLTALPYEYDADAPAPEAWFEFLDQLWKDDRESVDLLQEWFGCVLSGMTSFQKMLLIVGPRRSGKSTIARVLSGLVGRENVAGPTLDQLGQNFGLSSLMGKSLAVIGDARFASARPVTVERLLSITGEDCLDIDRKNKPLINVRLPVRIMILSNELPALSESSGALASRFLGPLVTSESFLGREDRHLEGKLLAELPSILNWALEGLDALLEQDHFTEPSTVIDVARDLEELSSPVTAFMRECCRREEGMRVTADDLFKVYKRWCNTQGIRNIPTFAIFCRNVKSAFPELKFARTAKGFTKQTQVIYDVAIHESAQVYTLMGM